MKKTYDLGIIELGLKTQTFFFFDVMALFYNACDYDLVNSQVEDGFLNNRYDWTMTNFDAIPTETRRRLVHILLRQKDFAERDVDFMDEFYSRIYCVLRTLLGLEKVCKKKNGVSYYDLYSCHFEDLVSPVTVVKEFLMWHKAGLPVTPMEQILLKDCVLKFLPDFRFDDEQSVTALKQKKEELRRKLCDINAQFRLIGACIKRLKQADDDSKNVLNDKLDRIYDDRCDILQSLALAEAYPILMADFPLWDDKEIG